MKRAVWKREYEIGVEKVDQEHMRLVKLCRAMADAILVDKDEAVMGQVLAALKLYTEEHFRDEEVELERLKSPLARRMKIAHARLEAQLHLIIDGFGKRPHVQTLEDLLTWLETELLPHFTGMDVSAFLATPEGRKAHARRLYSVA